MRIGRIGRFAIYRTACNSTAYPAGNNRHRNVLIIRLVFDFHSARQPSVDQDVQILSICWAGLPRIGGLVGVPFFVL